MGAIAQIRVKRPVVWTIIATGITSVTTQLLTVREFLTQFHGNEITISLVLFCWLLLTGLGSLLAKGMRHATVAGYSLLCLIVAVWPLVQIAAIRGLREIFFVHGASPGFHEIFFYILGTTAPYCLLIGFILPHAQKVILPYDAGFGSGDLYMADSIGDIAGGVLFSFVVVYWLKPFAAIALTSALLILIALGLLVIEKRYALASVGAMVAALFFCGAGAGGLERMSLSGQYGDVVRYVESPHGRVIVSREEGQYTVWESGVPVYSGSDLVKAEEKTHFPLCQLDRVDRILLVSGGLGETLAEIAKYRPSRVDYVELDPCLIQAAKGAGLIHESGQVRVVHMDGRRYIRTSEAEYDAIIIDLPNPDTFQINRLFTVEFIAEAKRRLRNGGVLSLSAEYSPEYVGRAGREKLSTVYNTLKTHFRDVLVLPAGEAYFVCSDRSMTYDIPGRLEELGIPTAYVAGSYGGNVTEERRARLMEAVRSTSLVNTDLEPRLVRIAFQEWFSKHGVSPLYLILTVSVLLAIYLAFLRREEYVLFSTGVSVMGAEMLVIFTFQLIYGYVYLQIGAIVTAFLMGLLPGAWAGRKWDQGDKGLLILSELLLMALLLVFYLWAAFWGNHPGSLAFLAYGFVFSCLCGLQFPIAARMIGESSSPAAGCMAADLCGAAVGTIATGTLLVSFFGIRQAVAFLILIKISSSIMLLFTRRAGDAPR